MMRRPLAGLLLLLLVVFLPREAREQSAPAAPCVVTAAAGGTSDALTVPTLPCTPTTTLLVLTTPLANTTTSPTLSINGAVGQVILGQNGGALVPGQLQAGGRSLLNYNGVNWFLLTGIQSPVSQFDIRWFNAVPGTDSSVAIAQALQFVSNNSPGSEITCGGNGGAGGLKYTIGAGAAPGVPILGTLVHPVKLRHCNFAVSSMTATTDILDLAPGSSDFEGWGFSDIGIYPLSGNPIWRHTFVLLDGGNGSNFIRHLEMHEISVGSSTGRTGDDLNLTASINFVSPTIINAAGSGYGNTLSGTLTWSGSGCTVPPVLGATSNSGGGIASISSVTAGVCQIYPSTSATTWTPGGGLSAGSGVELALTPTGTGLLFSSTLGPNLTFFRGVNFQNLGDSVTFLQTSISGSSYSFNVSNHPDGAGEFDLQDPSLTASGGLTLTGVYGTHIRGGAIECIGTALSAANNSFINVASSSNVSIDRTQVQGGGCSTPPAVLFATNTTNIDALFIAGSNLAGTDLSGRYTVDAGSTGTAAIAEMGGGYYSFTSVFGALCGSGTIGSGNSVSLFYRWIPHTTDVEAHGMINIGSAGTGTCTGAGTAITNTLPFKANQEDATCIGKEVAVSGKMISMGAAVNTSTTRVVFYDNSDPIANNSIFDFRCSYKASR